MPLPVIGIRTRIFLLGTLALLVLAALLGFNFYRATELLRSSADVTIREQAKAVAAAIDRGTVEAVTAARGLAMAAEEGLFGRRRELRQLARAVLESQPRFAATWYAFEVNADGLDAVGEEQTDADGIGDDGRFRPAWQRDATASARITAGILAAPNSVAYEACRSLSLDSSRSDKAFVSDPQQRDGATVIDHAWPIVIEDRFVGAAGVSQSALILTDELRRICDRLLESGGAPSIAIVGRDGTVLASSEGIGNGDGHATGGNPWTTLLPDLGTFGTDALDFRASAVVRAVDPLTGVDSLMTGVRIPTAGWTLVVRKPWSEITGRGLRPMMESLAIAAGALIVLTGLLAWLAAAISRRIALAGAIARRVAAGDLTSAFNSSGSDETGTLLRDMGSMTDSLRNLVDQVRGASLDLHATSRQLAVAGGHQEDAINSLGTSTTQVAAASRQISVTGKELLATMNDVAAVASETAVVADAGRENLDGIGETMRHLEQSTNDFGERLALIRQRAEDINMVITTITKVADQTNLLSINAAIEAEKAGDYGQGFIVVAREIRRLANQTAVATLDIERLVEQMQQAVSAGVSEMDRFAAEVKAGVGRVTGISSQFNDVITKVQGLTARFEHVNDGMHSQATGAQQIAEALVTLTDGSRSAAEALDEYRAASRHMVHAVDGLTQTVGRFRLEDDN